MWRSKLPRAVVLVVLVASLLPSLVFADHFEYLAEDQSKQVSAEPGIENFVDYWWMIGSSVYWWSQSSIKADVEVALANWENAIPKLNFIEKPLESQADLVFKSGVCLNPNNIACFTVTDWYYNSTRRGDYILESQIVIDLSENWTVSGKRGALAHELGHLYGLHERYDDDGGFGCNASETTVMDGLTGDPILHCDGLEGPASLDETRVRSFWGEGEQYLMAGVGPGPVGHWTWEDKAWAEYKHQVGLYYYDASVPEWVLYYSNQYFFNDGADGIGIHRAMAAFAGSRVFNADKDRRAYGASAGWHINCADPYFAGLGKYGTWRCSNVIWLN